ncbi:potassium channel family protein [Thermohalobacter berrensis]|uniref:potassium channel family protein n=1 Tax=Thermohalobacter berrensis TaxID=99594 RepID=UPI0015FFA573|nr:ion channel [Thermohalobacter berrensis]
MHISILATKLYKSLVIAILFIIFFSSLFYLFEAPYNKNIKSFIDALWWGFVTSTTVGYGDIYPVTSIGRVIAILLMIIGIGAFGFITASIASVLVEKNLKKGMGLMDVNFSDHIIVIGWNYRSKSIIEELTREDKNIEIALIDNNLDQNPYNNKNISYIKGDPTNDQVLNRANIKEAKTVIVLADKKLNNAEMIDAKSVLICLAVDRINPNVYLIAEVLNHLNIVHFKRANVDDIIISSQFESRILMRCALYKGVSKAFKELMTNSYGNEIYEMSNIPQYNNKPYKEVAIDFLNKKATLIGYYRDDKIFLNPDSNTILTKDDILLYIAENKIKL